ncbi:MAG: hypothetical protein HOM68_28770 [Gemmatimonadetes bacterium]|nr:hypothetical protein [Gemmatimonadota bacterium]MBT4612206.1 hypothetical protein [Gemmatimonadota bacterium]MBT5060572.1 hypothetical protein [Gemmatimonadota bacterium]MBT5146261.1 hypothetical protein [Gemmatimonadota bacterium]MBT5588973.1 hypothetical protein [Gemmatimonadota bacterium]
MTASRNLLFVLSLSASMLGNLSTVGPLSAAVPTDGFALLAPAPMRGGEFAYTQHHEFEFSHIEGSVQGWSSSFAYGLPVGELSFTGIVATETGGISFDAVEADLRLRLDFNGAIPFHPHLRIGVSRENRTKSPDDAHLGLQLHHSFRRHWHGAVHLAYEGATDGSRSYLLLAGLRRQRITPALGAGFEVKSEITRHSPVKERPQILIGPSLAWRLSDQTELRVNSLFGFGGGNETNVVYLFRP